MGQAVPRVGDKNSAGGLILRGDSTVLVNGIPLILTNDVDTCGHPRVGGSPDVTLGG